MATSVMYARIIDSKNDDGLSVAHLEGPFYAGTAQNDEQLKELLKAANAEGRGGTVFIKTYKNMSIQQAYEIARLAFVRVFEDVYVTRQILQRKKRHGMAR